MEESMKKKKDEALLDAAKAGDVAAVRALLDDGVDVDVRHDYGRSALHVAAQNGQTGVVHLLLERHAHVDAVDTDGSTPLHVAARSSQSDVVRLLLERHANVGAKSRKGWTPLHHAVGGRPMEVIRLMLEQNTDTNVETSNSRSSPSLSVGYRQMEVVRLLLEHNADMNVETTNGRTPLYIAAGNGHMDVVRLLLERHVHVDAVDENGWTPLHFAAKRGRAGVACLLLEHNAKVDAMDKDGRTPLHHACGSGQREVVRLLLERSANANAQDYSKATPLEFAAKNGHNDVSLLLLERGADIDTRYETYDLYRPLLLYTIAFLVGTGGSISAHMLILDRLLRRSLHFVLSSAFDSVRGNLVEEVRLWRQLDELSSKVDAVNVITRCLDFWQHQIDDAIELTEIPEEVATEGSESVELYISALTDSSSSTYRHKVCVVGPTTAGKTSLIKSLTRGESTLEEIDTRTVGIDLFSHHFESDGKQHEVTFWDFAGQDVYHAAHTVFFSRRTLFLVVVDLAKYASVLPPANERAQIAEPRIRRLVDEHVLHWMRLILTRLPDAMIAFVGTKTDLVAAETVDDIHADLERRIACWCDDQSALQMEHQAPTSKRSSVSWIDLRKNLTTAAQAWITVSSTDIRSIQETLKRLEQLIISQQRGFLMPDAYSSILGRIRDRRSAPGSSLAAQVQSMFVTKDHVITWLVQLFPMLHANGCKLVMRTLHELGDVLWYDASEVASALKVQACLAPDLVINLVREIVSHELFELMSGAGDHKSMSQELTTRQVIYRDIRDDRRFPEWKEQLTGSGCVDGGLIKRLPLWRDVNTQDTRLALKSLLQHLGLAYPVGDDEVMQCDSSLIFPAYWKIRDAFDLCCDKRHLLAHMILSTKCSALLYEYAWEFEFDGSYFPPTLFETVIVHTFAPSAKRVVTTPDRVVAVVPDEGVIRLERVGTHRKKLIRVEAIAVTKELAEKLVLYHCSIVESALAEYPGLDPFVQIVGRDDSQTKSLEEKQRQELLQSSVIEAPVQKSRPWTWWWRTEPTTKQRLPRLCQSTERPIPLHMKIQVCELSWGDATTTRTRATIPSMNLVRTKWSLRPLDGKSNLKSVRAQHGETAIEFRDVPALPVLKLCELRVIVKTSGSFLSHSVLACGSLSLDDIIPDDSLGVFQVADVKMQLALPSREAEIVGLLRCNISCIASHEAAGAA